MDPFLSFNTDSVDVLVGEDDEQTSIEFTQVQDNLNYLEDNSFGCLADVNTNLYSDVRYK